MRVAARRLESLVDLFGAGGKRRRRARRELRALRRALGPARETRVLIGRLAARQQARLVPEAAAPGTERAARTAVALWLADAGARLARHEREAGDFCARPRLRRVARRVERALRWTGDPAQAARRSGRAHARLEAARRRAEERIDAARAEPADGRLHAARVAIKRWRYALERTQAVENGADGPALGPLVELQRRLGALQDLADLRRVVAGMVERLQAHDAGTGADAVAAFGLTLERERTAQVAAFLERIAAPPETDARTVLRMPPRS